MDSYTEGGDPVCWLSRVCPECGAFAEGVEDAECPRCGTPLDESGGASDS